MVEVGPKRKQLGQEKIMADQGWVEKKMNGSGGWVKRNMWNCESASIKCTKFKINSFFINRKIKLLQLFQDAVGIQYYSISLSDELLSNISPCPANMLDNVHINENVYTLGKIKELYLNLLMFDTNVYFTYTRNKFDGVGQKANIQTLAGCVRKSQELSKVGYLFPLYHNSFSSVPPPLLLMTGPLVFLSSRWSFLTLV